LKTILLFLYLFTLQPKEDIGQKSKMSSRKLSWHNVDECTYVFGSHPNHDAGKPGDQKAVTTRTKPTSTTTKPTSIATTKEKGTKSTSMGNTTAAKVTGTTSMAPKTATSKANMKPTTTTTLAKESDRDERMLRMLHDAIFWASPALRRLRSRTISSSMTSLSSVWHYNSPSTSSWFLLPSSLQSTRTCRPRTTHTSRKSTAVGCVTSVKREAKSAVDILKMYTIYNEGPTNIKLILSIHILFIYWTITT